MYTLGVSFDYHDAAAALLKENEVVAAAQEERFSLVKNDPSFPAQAIQFCCQYGQIEPRELDHVIYHENAILKFDRILWASLHNFPQNVGYLKLAVKNWVRGKKFVPTLRLAEFLGLPPKKVSFIRHHQSHAASAFFCSPFAEAVVVTIDGVGEYETTGIFMGRDNTLKQIGSIRIPHSLGLFYSAITAFLGFKVNEDEYKVMGMAGYGQPRFFQTMMDHFVLHKNGTFSLDQQWFHFLCPRDKPYSPEFLKVFGPPREPESPFDTVSVNSREGQERRGNGLDYADIAASAQKCAETVILHLVTHAMRKTRMQNVCMAGGVALNGLANGRVKRELGANLYVHPAAGDAGCALGAALYWNHCFRKRPRKLPMANPFLGKAYSNSEIGETLKRLYVQHVTCVDDNHELCARVAQMIHQGGVVGWMQGRFEWGPRALGNRSILANPTRPDMQRIVNEKIKFREPFRPFAPAVLADRGAEFFDMGNIIHEHGPEFFMVSVCRVRDEKKGILPAVTHVDGTARVQLVSPATNPLFYQLISAFEKISGVPVLLNTSFNLRGEPIVNSPKEAIRTYEWSEMDHLVIGNYLISKRAG